MKKTKWQIILGIILAVLSGVLYIIHFFIFRDSSHIFIYLLGDVAFLPVEVLFVTLIIDRVLSFREKRSLLKKLNMVMGAFFSEVGLKLLFYFSTFDLNTENIRNNLSDIDKWSEKDFNKIKLLTEKFKYSINAKAGDLYSLKNFLS